MSLHSRVPAAGWLAAGVPFAQARIGRVLALAILAALLVAGGTVSRAAAPAANWYHFSPDGRECVVTQAVLPTPWLNRLTNDVFATWITHDGYIESYLLDPNLNGLTNPQKTSGRFFVRDAESGQAFEVNRPEGAEPWESRIGLGYDRISHTALGLTGVVTYFVPRNGDNVLVMTVDVTNQTDRPRTVDLFGQVEFNLGDPVKSIIRRGDGRGGSQFNLYKQVTMQDNVLYAIQRNWRSTAACIPWPYTGFFTANAPVESFETIKAKFVGLGRDADHPAEVAAGRCSNTAFWSEAEYPWGVLENRVHLAPHATQSVVYVLGMARDSKDIPAIAARYATPQKAAGALAAVRDYYGHLVDGLATIDTPDKDNDRIINIWSKYQWRQGLKRNLNNGTYGLGVWSYGIEDASAAVQPEVAIVPADLALLKSCVVGALQNQLPDTTQTQLFVQRQTTLDADYGRNPADAAKVRGHFAIPHHHDIWAFLPSIYFYIVESGDLGLLNQHLPYIDGTSATVWDHVKTAITIATKVLDAHGLARIPQGVGDWMDEFTMISAHGQAQSVMLSEELAFILRSYADLAERHGDQAAAAQWRQTYERIKTAVNATAWDGEWYSRATCDLDGTVIGSRKTDGRIYLNAQSWAIYSGIAPNDRATRSLASVRQRLVSPYGPLIFAPAYDHFDRHIGTQSVYAPGFRNACIYMRPAGWAIIAACLEHDGDLAYTMYENAALSTRARSIGTLESEPYVYPENYDGPDHRLRGRGEFQWNFGEGTAWMWYSYVGYILGVRPTLDGLLIDPNIPAQWDGFRMRRSYRGHTFDITVDNRSHTGHGVRSLTVEGRPVRGNIISTDNLPPTVRVRVEL